MNADMLNRGSVDPPPPPPPPISLSFLCTTYTGYSNIYKYLTPIKTAPEA